MDNADNLGRQQTSFIQRSDGHNFSKNQPINRILIMIKLLCFQLIVVIMVVMVFVGGRIYYLGTKQNNSFIQPTATQQTQITEYQPLPTAVTNTTKMSSQITSPQITGIQNYHSQEFGFSVKIPDGWNYNDRKGRGGKEGTAWLAVNVELFRNNNTIYVPIYVDEKNLVSYKPELLKEFFPDKIEETTFAGQPALRIVKESQYYYWIQHPKEANKILCGQAIIISPPAYTGSDQKNTDINNSFDMPISQYFQTSVDAILNSIIFD